MGVAVCHYETIFSNGVSLGVLTMDSRTGPTLQVVSKHKTDPMFACFGAIFVFYC